MIWKALGFMPCSFYGMLSEPLYRSSKKFSERAFPGSSGSQAGKKTGMKGEKFVVELQITTLDEEELSRLKNPALKR